MIKNPKISVIMSVHNGEKYLKEAIESILKQTFSDFEFIIVDDGSTDKTSDILKEYSKRDSRIKIIANEKNIGLTKSLNKALKIAKGKYIARQDADDVSLPERFEKQIAFLKNRPDVKLLGTFAYSINRKGEILRKEILPTSPEEIKRRFIKRNFFIHGSVMLEKETLDKVGGFYNENYQTSQDYELWFRFLKVAKGANLPLFLVKKRYSPEMISLAREEKQLKTTIALRKEVIKRGDYPKWSYIYLLRPYLTLKCPLFLKKFLRRHFAKSRNLFRKI